MKVYPPNYTQIPNALLDLMPKMTESELRVTLAIARKTFGWGKRADRISLSQLEKLTGMRRQGVQNGLTAALERNPPLILREQHGQAFVYRMNVVEPDETSPLSGLVHERDQSTKETRTSPLSGPELVHLVDTQNKVKTTTKNDDVVAALIDLKVTRNQAIGLKKSNPDLTVEHVNAWAAYLEKSDKGIGFLIWSLKEGELTPPADRKNGKPARTYDQLPGESNADYSARIGAYMRGG